MTEPHTRYNNIFRMIDMKNMIQKQSILAFICLFISTALSAAPIHSLRGDRPIDAESAPATIKKNIRDREPIPRSYVQQPPLIPHKVKGYKINLKFNKCLTCHSWANYKKSGATKVSLTHFENRDGEALSNISPRRYFCTQCHVRQTEATPLVDNNFHAVNVFEQ